MSNTAVLFNALQPAQSSQHHHNTTMMMNNHNNNNKYHPNPSTNRHSNTGTVTTNSTTTVDSSIRRGADIVRKQIHQQQQQQQSMRMMMMNPGHTATPNNQYLSSTTPLPPPTSSSHRMEPFSSKQHHHHQQQQRVVYDVDDDEEVTTEDNNNDDHISVTSWSEYDALPEYHHRHSAVVVTTSNGGGGGGNSTTCSVEIDPPSIADWSIDADTIVTTTNEQQATKETNYNFGEDDSLFHDDDPEEEEDSRRVLSKVPAPIANYDNTAMLMMMEQSSSQYPPKQQQPAPTTGEGGFISSDDDDDDNKDRNDKNDETTDDSNSDIVEINQNDAVFDPFRYSASPTRRTIKGTGQQQRSPSSPKIDTKLLSTTTATNIVAITNSNNNQNNNNNSWMEQRSPRNTYDPDDNTTDNGGEANNSHEYNHRTVGLLSSPNSSSAVSGIRNGYPLPFQIQQQEEEVEAVTSNNNTTTTTHRPSSLFMDYDVDAYCGFNVDTDDPIDNNNNNEPQEYYHSPTEKPVREVPIHTPSTISNLSTPGMTLQRQQRQYQHQTSTSAKIMILYDQLLCDPAYLHAQNAGFIWQSIVGQHIRFPTSWWNGARGPPIQSGSGGYTMMEDTMNDTDNIPWMYFGRHTIADHPVLNQLVKCRASAGRLLLHIVVQDLMTRTPIQDIVIGCFHPNSKVIRSSNTPALKRYEPCRDIWMAVRKRCNTSVAATDSLLYSPSHWENPQHQQNNSQRHRTCTTTTSAYEYSISRSPLGSGQRVTNHNVRAVFGDKSPLETIFLSEDELYERLAARILVVQQHRQQQQHKSNNKDTTNNNNANMDMSPALAILQELVFA